MLVRASLATARDLPPGQTATPFAALNAGLDPVSSECLCLRKGNPAINGRGSLGLSSRSSAPAFGINEAQDLAGMRAAGLTTTSTAPLELDPSGRERKSPPVPLALAESREETIMAKWERQGESNERSRFAMASGAGRQGALSGSGSPASGRVDSQQNSDRQAEAGAAATLEAASEQPVATLTLGEWKPGLTPDSGLVGVGTSAERTLFALATAAYLPGAAPVSRETAALSQRVSLLEKSNPSSVTASNMAPARAPAWGGSQQQTAASGARSGPAWAVEGQWAPSVPWQKMPAAEASAPVVVAQIAETLGATGSVVAKSAQPAAPEEAVAAVAGVDLLMASAPEPSDDPAIMMIIPAADPLKAAVDNPEPGTLALISIGALLVVISQIGNRKKTS